MKRCLESRKMIFYSNMIHLDNKTKQLVKISLYRFIRSRKSVKRSLNLGCVNHVCDSNPCVQNRGYLNFNLSRRLDSAFCPARVSSSGHRIQQECQLIYSFNRFPKLGNAGGVCQQRGRLLRIIFVGGGSRFRQSGISNSVKHRE